MENKFTPAKKFRVLFVCLGNSCRSPMAEAVARKTACDVIAPASAGTIALGFVAPFTTQVLEEREFGAEGLASKQINAEMRRQAEIIINMTGTDARRLFASEESKTEDWLVSDPYGDSIEAYRDTCDEIEARMAEFAARLRSKRGWKPGRPALSY
jgi:arsenate reductase (thioredoxin)